jgi:rhodanese-related sulfurtransferase
LGKTRAIAGLVPGGIDKNVLFVDVREPAEFAGERFPGSVNLPLSRLEADAAALPRGRTLVVLCRSGRRAQDAAKRFVKMGFLDVRVAEGGLSACRGLERGEGGVWDMERQVRMAAGCLVLLGGALGQVLHPGFWLLSIGVGAGLVFSAATDTCTMASVLARMPWNRGP